MKRSVKKKKPFFAFVPFTHAHVPVTAHPDFAGKTGNGPYADVLTEIDYNSGKIGLDYFLYDMVISGPEIGFLFHF